MEKHSLRMLHDRIAVIEDEPDTKLPCGLFLPELAQRRKRSGVVVAVGPGYTDNKGRFVPTTVKVGDRVVFGSYAGATIKLGLNTYKIMRESDLACVITDDNASIDATYGSTGAQSTHAQYM